MNIYLVLSILFVHWIADFVLQTDRMAKSKSKNFECLLAHTGMYLLVFMFASGIYVIIYTVHDANLSGRIFILFPFITFFAHTIQDYITSRINAELLSKGKTHLFYVSFGFDQFLHFAQLLITFKLLTP